VNDVAIFSPSDGGRKKFVPHIVKKELKNFLFLFIVVDDFWRVGIL
jgi:hypothetical protein